MTTPGFTEVDLVSHSGNSASGEFAHTLNVTDIHTTWTESRAVLGRGEEAVQRALNEIAGVLPFALLGVDSDNGSEFINWHLKSWSERKQIQLTRGRPYKKDDNAHIEQKNWTHVRKLLGWDRYDTHEAVAAINELYGHELRKIGHRRHRRGRLRGRHLQSKVPGHHGLLVYESEGQRKAPVKANHRDARKPPDRGWNILDASIFGGLSIRITLVSTASLSYPPTEGVVTDNSPAGQGGALKQGVVFSQRIAGAMNREGIG